MSTSSNHLTCSGAPGKIETDTPELRDPFHLQGTVLDGRYHVESVVGEGGFSVVYRARHIRFACPVAIKVLKPQIAGLDASFQDEGRILVQLSSVHSSIIHAMETGTFTSEIGAVVPYLVLEWLDGVTLAAEAKYRRDHGLAPFSLH
jgi:serine/threonine-protein kinase